MFSYFHKNDVSVLDRNPKTIFIYDVHISKEKRKLIVLFVIKFNLPDYPFSRCIHSCMNVCMWLLVFALYLARKFVLVLILLLLLVGFFFSIYFIEMGTENDKLIGLSKLQKRKEKNSCSLCDGMNMSVLTVKSTMHTIQTLWNVTRMELQVVLTLSSLCQWP